jgi:hypothetical protein
MELNDLVGAEKSLRLSLKLSQDSPDKKYQNRRTHFMLGRLLTRTNRKAEGDSGIGEGSRDPGTTFAIGSRGTQ